MKAFLEEYGVIVVAVIVILLLIAFASVFGGDIVNAIKGTISTLTTKGGITPATVTGAMVNGMMH